MKFLIAIFGIVGAIVFLLEGDPTSIVPFWLGLGLILWVWQTIVSAGRQITNSLGGDTYNLSQNKYEFTESDDPTRPNENIPAIIEIGRKR